MSAVSAIDALRLRPICLFLPSFGDGGVERMMTNISHGLAELSCRVDFVVGSPDAPYLDTLPPEVRLHCLPHSDRRVYQSFLRDYVERDRPSVVLSAKFEDDRLALNVKAEYPSDTRYFVCHGTTKTAQWKAGGLKGWIKARQERGPLRNMFNRADGIIAVSHGVAEDAALISGLPLNRIRVVKNPSITPGLIRRALATVDHPWFTPDQPPVIMGIGGLRNAKDFATLIRAFSRLRRRLPCRLMILGQGRQHERLERLAQAIGVGNDVALPGFDPNPYRFLARAKLFVLSSRWEGSPNVLIEALGLGVPVVATNCRSGPSEILQGGRYGPLVPVGDVEALAHAMEETLLQPQAPEVLREAVSDYRLDISARGYLEAFGLVS